MYPIFKIFSSAFKKFKEIKLLSFIARYRPWNVHVLATTPHSTKQFKHYTELFTRNVSYMEVTHLFGVVAIFRVSNKYIFFLFFMHNSTMQSTDNDLLFWGEIHYHWHLATLLIYVCADIEWTCSIGSNYIGLYRFTVTERDRFLN